MPSSSLVYHVGQVLQRAGLSRSDRLVVGLSGGADSLALTHVLAELHREGQGPAPLAVHVDHGLRPESGEDARRVVELGRAVGVAVEVIAVDVDGWQAVQRQGVEAAARAARYAALANAARQHGVDILTVAHTRDDQSETVLLRLARGTSLDGLTGMRELSRRAIPLDPADSSSVSCRIIRPLLRSPRDDVRRYLAEHHLEPIEDASNASVRYRRNAVRHEILPLLEQYAPGATGSIARTAALLGADADLLRDLARAALSKTVYLADGVASVDRTGFRGVHPALQRRVLAQILIELGGEHAPLSEERIEALRQSAIDSSGSSTIEIGRGIVGLIAYGRVFIGSAERVGAELARAAGLPQMRCDSAIEIAVAGYQHVGLADGWALDLAAPERLRGWALRVRQPGDRLLTGEDQSVRLQDWLVNRKIPARLRDRLPLLVQHGMVRWIAGVTGDRFEDRAAGVSARVVRHERDEEETGA